MTVVTGPVMGRRVLAADLRRIRSESGRTIEDVARHLECSPAKVSRMETGTVKVGVQDLRALVELYAVTGVVREELFALVRQSRERGWWAEYADAVPAGSGQFFGLEDSAASIEQHCCSLMPGLLQSRAYASAVIDSVPAIEPWLATRRLELRMRRQQLLDRPDPPRLSVLLDEAVLWRRIGDHEVMAGQLRHLLAMAERPNVVLRVIEFSAPTHPAVGASFTVFGFGAGSAGLQGTETVVYQEQLASNTFLDQPDDVAVLVTVLAAAELVAASESRTHDLLRERLATL